MDSDSLISQKRKAPASKAKPRKRAALTKKKETAPARKPSPHALKFPEFRLPIDVFEILFKQCDIISATVLGVTCKSFRDIYLRQVLKVGVEGKYKTTDVDEAQGKDKTEGKTKTIAPDSSERDGRSEREENDSDEDDSSDGDDSIEEEIANDNDKEMEHDETKVVPIKHEIRNLNGSNLYLRVVLAKWMGPKLFWNPYLQKFATKEKLAEFTEDDGLLTKYAEFSLDEMAEEKEERREARHEANMKRQRARERRNERREERREAKKWQDEARLQYAEDEPEWDHYAQYDNKSVSEDESISSGVAFDVDTEYEDSEATSDEE